MPHQRPPLTLYSPSNSDSPISGPISASPDMRPPTSFTSRESTIGSGRAASDPGVPTPNSTPRRLDTSLISRHPLANDLRPPTPQHLTAQAAQTAIAAAAVAMPNAVFHNAVIHTGSAAPTPTPVTSPCVKIPNIDEAYRVKRPREEEKLLALYTREAEKPLGEIAIWGIPGAGKDDFVVAFLRQECFDHEHNRIFLNAADELTFRASLQKHFPELADRDFTADEARQCFTRSQYREVGHPAKWIIALSHVKTPPPGCVLPFWQAYLPDTQPDSSGGVNNQVVTIYISHEKPEAVEKYADRMLQLDNLTEDEAIQLVHDAFKSLNEATIKELIKAVGCRLSIHLLFAINMIKRRHTSGTPINNENVKAYFPQIGIATKEREGATAPTTTDDSVASKVRNLKTYVIEKMRTESLATLLGILAFFDIYKLPEDLAEAVYNICYLEPREVNFIDARKALVEAALIFHRGSKLISIETVRRIVIGRLELSKQKEIMLAISKALIMRYVSQDAGAKSLNYQACRFLNKTAPFVKALEGEEHDRFKVGYYQLISSVCSAPHRLDKYNNAMMRAIGIEAYYFYYNLHEYGQAYTILMPVVESLFYAGNSSEYHLAIAKLGELAEKMPADPANPTITQCEQQAQLLGWQGSLYFKVGDLEKAIDLHTQALSYEFKKRSFFEAQFSDRTSEAYIAIICHTAESLLDLAQDYCVRNAEGDLTFCQGYCEDADKLLGNSRIILNYRIYYLKSRVHYHLAEVYYRQDNYPKALAELDAMERDTKSSGIPDNDLFYAYFYLLKGLVLARLEDSAQQAKDHLVTGENLLSGHGAPEHRLMLEAQVILASEKFAAIEANLLRRVSSAEFMSGSNRSSPPHSPLTSPRNTATVVLHPSGPYLEDEQLTTYCQNNSITCSVISVTDHHPFFYGVLLALGHDPSTSQILQQAIFKAITSSSPSAITPGAQTFMRIRAQSFLSSGFRIEGPALEATAIHLNIQLTLVDCISPSPTSAATAIASWQIYGPFGNSASAAGESKPQVVMLRQKDTYFLSDSGSLAQISALIASAAGVSPTR